MAGPEIDDVQHAALGNGAKRARQSMLPIGDHRQSIGNKHPIEAGTAKKRFGIEIGGIGVLENEVVERSS